MTKLSVKQQKFADLYIETGNATQSAIDAGYAKKSARSVGSENLTKPDIKEYIDKHMTEMADKRIMSAQDALELLTRIANGEEKETKVVATQFDVSEVEVPADLKTKIAAVKEILKRYPTENPLTQAQIRKLEAEADIKEAEAAEIKDATENVGEVMIVDDIPTN
ncbi:terminase small subunit [Latilactobacillus sakei]|uniref:terminase small subunit n=1 Tax=Latilactobacillus sakei TaxID=1599 RepID=UPI000EAA5256|nr:terminase small subunit [Latilactobacillus sakei]AYG16519.1 terminase small subunit [Latilactobacillus sakei]AYG25240.1 terminase small subunit [Latilactobacillus sakei]AYG30382.1 terminase small subunit [Latilactobacillus sakei]AYG32159.1 terminase small subunit [Latilactobacillus sakei]